MRRPGFERASPEREVEGDHRSERDAPGCSTLTRQRALPAVCYKGARLMAARNTHEAAAGEVAAVLSQLQLYIDEVRVR